MKTIGRNDIANIESVNQITIPDGVICIEEEAFRDCEKLESVIIPNSVTMIEEGAFYNCAKLVSMRMSNSVLSIGEMAFSETALSSVSLPQSVKEIGLRAFDCPVHVEESNEYYSVVDGVLFNKEKTELVSFPCKHGQTSYAIPDHVKKIGAGAFYGCHLTSLVIPESVFDIGEQAFYEMEMPGFMDIPPSVVRIGEDAFIHPIDVYHYVEDWFIDDYAIIIHTKVGDTNCDRGTFGNRLIYVPEQFYDEWNRWAGKTLFKTDGTYVNRIRCIP